MAMHAALYSDARSSSRLAVNLDATLRKSDQLPQDVLVDDLSTTGFRMAAANAPEIGATVSVGLSGIGRREARVAWRSGSHCGCEFLAPVATADIARALDTDTIVAADFGMGQVAAPTAAVPALDRRLRQYRGLLILAGLALPWFAIATLARELVF